MKLSFDKRAYRFLLIVSIFSFAMVPLFLTQHFFPNKLGIYGLPYTIFSFSALFEGIMNLRWAIMLKKKIEPAKFCKKLARYELAVNPLFVLTVLFLTVAFPVGTDNWLALVNLSLVFMAICFRIFIVIYFNKLMKQGDTGYIGFRNHYANITLYLFIIFLFYFLSNFKIMGNSLNVVTRDGLLGLSDVYLILSVIEIILGMILLMQNLYFSIATYYSGVDDEAFDLRNNLEHTKQVLIQHDIPFWFSVFSCFILLVISTVLSFQFPDIYGTFAILYLIILLIKIPSFFKKKQIERREEDPYKQFVKKHQLLIYTAILLIAYGVLSSIFGVQAFQKLDYNDTKAFVAFGVFVPWAFFKIFIGAKSYKFAKENIEPMFLVNAYIDILISIFTLAKTIVMLSFSLESEALRVTSTIIGIFVSVYSFYVSVAVIIIGIRGLKGKRKDYYLKHNGVFGINNIREAIGEAISSVTHHLSEEVDEINEDINKIDK